MPAPSAAHRAVHSAIDETPHRHQLEVRRELATRRPVLVLGRYTAPGGRARELVLRDGAGGSTLVLDRDGVTLGDRRLVAHLGADEAPENAVLVSDSYLTDARRGRGRCRRVTLEDYEIAPFPEDDLAEPAPLLRDGGAQLLDRDGFCFRLEPLQTGMSIPELRWRAHPPAGTGGEPYAVSVRHAISRLESYEPVRALTRRAVALHRRSTETSIAMLRSELVRVQESPMVLNRGLRAMVLAAIERQGLSMSEIAIRCGRVKLDCRGNESGETSWLARRLGLLPEGGRTTPTPWIHSDVLALIARRGLGISPLEAELG